MLVRPHPKDLVKQTFAEVTGSSDDRAFGRWLAEGVFRKSEYEVISSRPDSALFFYFQNHLQFQQIFNKFIGFAFCAQSLTHGMEAMRITAGHRNAPTLLRRSLGIIQFLSVTNLQGGGWRYYS